MRSSASLRAPALLFLLVTIAACGTTPRAAGPATIQPGAPGEASRDVTGSEVVRRPARHSPADVSFMTGMIVHHAQAVVMTALVPERTQNPTIRLLARRIAASQEDEMALMTRWLTARGEAVPGEHAHHGHADHVHMPGMLSDEQLAQLAGARNAEFDRLFLEFMIQHHEGALVMVEQLFASETGGQDVEIFNFASHVDSDQRMEIGRMRALLGMTTGAGT
jgi:uncharacterized protein (DUF305 family)